ncbi:PREDICTED: lysine-specific demethylase hairless isoform X2 [Crocodylus porosus]|uniref:lysine-specific demethylase hairless isoform X2 n=1 Tax=Crocodylus porosus TaxID=8502 RepID=UPI00093A64B0|nr:PREDICTED: lysine-specific demethylase hairless isoform X2 [Crocodylus porosus]
MSTSFLVHLSQGSAGGRGRGRGRKSTFPLPPTPSCPPPSSLLHHLHLGLALSQRGAGTSRTWAQGTLHPGARHAPHEGQRAMESAAESGEAIPRRRKPQEGGRDPWVMESSGAGAGHRTTELEIPAQSYRDRATSGQDAAAPPEKTSFWGDSEEAKDFSLGLRRGCDTPRMAPGSPYPAGTDRNFSQPREDRLEELPRQPLRRPAPQEAAGFQPRNGEAKPGWVDRSQAEPGLTWAEAMLASQMALYCPTYPCYSLPFPMLESPTKPKQDALHAPSPPADGLRDHPAFQRLHMHCPFLTEATLAERNLFLVSSLAATSTPAESAHGNSLAGLARQPQDGPSPRGEACYAAADWPLASDPLPWSPSLYLAPHPRAKTSSAFETCSSVPDEEFYPKKDPHVAKDWASPPNHMQPRQLGQHEAGWGRREQESELDSSGAELVLVPLRKVGQREGSPAAPLPSSDPPLLDGWSPSGPALLYLKPGAEGHSGGSWPSRPPALDEPLQKPGARPAESKDDSLTYQSSMPGCPVGLPDSRRPRSQDAACQRSSPGCSPQDLRRCQGTGCGPLSPFGARLEGLGLYEEAEGVQGNKTGKLSALVSCLPSSHHTKLKKTWLTRHSEQDGDLAACLGDTGAGGRTKEGVPPQCPVLKREVRDGSSEADRPGKQAAKRAHGHIAREADRSPCDSEGDFSAKRSCKPAEETVLGAAGAGGLLSCNGGHASREVEKPYLQSVPCTALPDSIRRCCGCTARSREGALPHEKEELAGTGCRLLHFRRLAIGDHGKLSMDGFSMLDEAEGESLHLGVSGRERRGRDVSTSLSLAKYLLSVLGDQFCEAVRKDQEAWLEAQGGNKGVAAWRRGAGAPQACDACRRSLFSTHWSCPSCGFQLCSTCCRTQREQTSPGQAEDSVQPAECVQGPNHDTLSLVPSQFIPPHVLAELWKLMHEVRDRFDISARCPCRLSNLSKSPAVTAGSRQKTGSAAPSLQLTSNGDADGARAVKEESPDPGYQQPSTPSPKGAVQTSTLCDLLTSTAVKLCLGQNGVRMAFAPVSPALPSDNRITNILDSIIAQVVERKIQEKHTGSTQGSPRSLDPQVSHCLLAPGGLLWLQDPNHSKNYKLFQEHWRQGQPVLVSGLQKMLDGKLWGPESFCRERGEQEGRVLDLRAPAGRAQISSKDFWDGFASSATCLHPEHSEGSLLRLDSSLGDMEPCRAETLHASWPLLEYCGPDGMLNLVSYLPDGQGRLWLRPRLCAAYGAMPGDRAVGTKNLTVQATDSIHVLVHVGAAPPDWPAARQEILLWVEEDGLDGALKERLWDTSLQPGALWHIFRAEDADRIRGFLQEQVGEDPEEAGEGQLDPNSPLWSCYLGPSLRRKLREEYGVSSWTLLQFLGDAVLVPAGAPHQVQSLSSTITVEQRFLSPENAARSAQLAAWPTDPAGTVQGLHAQMDSMVYCAVREAVGTLQGYN